MSTLSCSSWFKAICFAHNSNPSDDPYWWKGRGDFEHSQPPERSREPGDTQSGSDAEESGSISSGRNSTLGSMNGAYHRSEKKTARFTEYSTSSSVIPRSEGLCDTSM